MRILILLVLVSQLLLAQNAKLDSTLSELRATDSPSEKAKIYTKLSYYYMSQDYDLASLYADSAYAVSSTLNDTFHLASSYGLLAQLKMRQGDQDSALYYYSKYSHLFDDFSNQAYLSSEAYLVGELGVVYYYKSMFDSARYYFDLAIDKNLQLGNQNIAARMQSNIGSILYNNADYDQALTYFRDAQLIFESDIPDTLALINVVNNIGLIFSDLHNYDKAIDYFETGINLSKLINSPINTEMLFLNIGTAHFELRDNDKALNYFEESLAIKKRNKIPFGINLNNIAQVYLDNGLLDSAKLYFIDAIKEYNKHGVKFHLIDAQESLATLCMELQEYDNAHKILLEVLQSIDPNDRPHRYLSLYQQLLQVSIHLEDSQSAYRYYNLFTSLNDSIRELSISEKVYEIESKYQLTQKESEIIIFQQKSVIELRKRQIIIFLTSIFILLILIVVLYLSLRAKNLLKNVKIVELENATKNKEILHNTMLLSKRNQDANNFLNELDELNKDLSSINLIALQKRIRTSSKIEDSWYEYLTAFTKINPNFNENLYSRNIVLTTSEKRLCALVAQGLTIGEISNIINIAPSSVSKARTRLRKKLELDSGDDLKDYLNSIGN